LIDFHRDRRGTRTQQKSDEWKWCLDGNDDMIERYFRKVHLSKSRHPRSFHSISEKILLATTKLVTSVSSRQKKVPATNFAADIKKVKIPSSTEKKSEVFNIKEESFVRLGFD
jgi:hypothetical protein